MESTSVPLPIRSPVLAFSRRYGAFDMDSIPPATATSYSPAWMAFDASMTARMPEPQTLWTVTQGTVFGMPAPSDAWRAGAWPIPAWRTLPRMTCSTSSGFTPERSSAARMAAEPRAGAGRDESFPRNEPTGVRAADRMTMSFIGGGFYCVRQPEVRLPLLRRFQLPASPDRRRVAVGLEAVRAVQAVEDGLAGLRGRRALRQRGRLRALARVGRVREHARRLRTRGLGARGRGAAARDDHQSGE